MYPYRTDFRSVGTLVRKHIPSAYDQSHTRRNHATRVHRYQLFLSSPLLISLLSPFVFLSILIPAFTAYVSSFFLLLCSLYLHYPLFLSSFVSNSCKYSAHTLPAVERISQSKSTRKHAMKLSYILIKQHIFKRYFLTNSDF
jgi:hypothetical protein